MMMMMMDSDNPGDLSPEKDCCTGDWHYDDLDISQLTSPGSSDDYYAVSHPYILVCGTCHLG